MKIINRKQALARGLPRYFTGKPCKRGHVAERRTLKGCCMQCRSEDREIWAADFSAMPPRSPAKKRAQRAKRRALKKNSAAAVGSCKKALDAIYAARACITKLTGIEHHVDHRVPLALGGAHHQDNLWIVTASYNLSKGARWKDETSS